MSYIGTQPVPQSLESRQEFTATASQTTFATSGYTVGYVDVYLNGVKLSTSDFTATNGSDVILGSGAAAGDVLAVVMKNDHSDLVALPITDSAGNNVLSESGGLVTIADTVQHVVPIVNANRSADQTGISAGTFTKVLFNNEVTDTHNFFDASINYRFQPTIAGYYIINTAVSITTTAGTRFITSLFKNLNEYIRLLDVVTTADAMRIPVSSIIQLNGSSDFIEIYGYADTTNALTFSSYVQGTFFNAFLLQRT